MSRSLFLSIIAAISVFFKILFGNNIFLLLFILILSYGIITDKDENKIEYLLFFTSWMYVIKFNFNQFSLFILISIVYIFSILVSMIKYKLKLNKSLLLVTSGFFIYITSVSSIGEIQSLMDILGFLIGYIVIFFAYTVLRNKDKFIDYAVMYALGIFLSAIVGFMRNFIPSIDNFLINMTRLNTVLVNGSVVNRIAGLDLDPNYFASNILIAISLLIVCIFYKKGGKMMYYLVIALFICGFFSLSKMYLIVSFLILIISICYFCCKNPLKIFKYLFVLLISISIIFMFFGNYILGAYASRLTNTTSISELTTGRFDIWIEYIEYIFNDLRVFLIGRGIGIGLNGRVSHNMYLLAWYYIGVIGIIITVIFFIALGIIIKRKLNIKNKIKILSINSLPLITILILNLSLDSFFMDFFCYQIFLSILSLLYYE